MNEENLQREELQQHDEQQKSQVQPEIENVEESAAKVEETVNEGEEEPSAESSEKVDEIEEKTDEADDSSVEKKEETSAEEEKEEEASPAEEQKEEVIEEESTEENKEESEEEENKIDIEAIQKELAELKAKENERVQLQELHETVRHLESEYDRVVNGINKALKETLEQYEIPTDITLSELEQKDKAKAEIARALIKQASEALDFNTHQLSQAYKQKEQQVIFTKAERLFNKYEMTNEQADIAAKTFVEILHASGLNDLEEDLSAKVELAVARAQFVHPNKTAAEVTTKVEKIEAEVPAEPEKADEKPSEEEYKEVVEKPQEEAPAPANEESVEVKKEEPPKPAKVDLSGYKEGVNEGTHSVTGAVVTKDNVLQKLASLPFKERQQFLKEHFSLVNEAMKDYNLSRRK